MVVTKGAKHQIHLRCANGFHVGVYSNSPNRSMQTETHLKKWGFLGNVSSTMKSFYRLVVSACIIGAAFGQSNTTISVTGTNTVKVPQNVVQVQLGVRNEANTAFEAQKMTSFTSNRVIETLRGYNVTDLQTEYLSLQPVYNYTETPTRIIGFESSTSLSYRTDPETAGATIDASIRAGANTVDSVTTTISDEDFQKLYIEALGGASKDAELKARTVLESMGMCIEGPVMINVYDHSVPPPSPTIMSYASVMAESASSAPTVVPGEQEVTASITVEYSFNVC